MKKILRTLLYILIAVLVLFGVFLVYASVTDFRPDEKQTIYENESPDAFNDTSAISLMIWNIGYAGLGKDMDFFYDGGEKVRADRETSLNNLEKIMRYLAADDSVDVFLFQEVDLESKRSYRINQFDSLASLFPDYTPLFAANYDVFFVPVPPAKPMGKVLGGLMSLSRYRVSEAVRYSFPGNYEWPKSLFMLDRCFLVNRYPLENGNELLIINTHNSAYDDGSLRAQQMEYLKAFLEEEYAKGNYIVVGGDWNQSPPNFEPNFTGQIHDEDNRSDIPSDFMADWTWFYDAGQPTNRRLKTSWQSGKTPTALIDFFLLSPNVEAVQIQTVDLGFEFSDHQPVKALVKLKTK